MAVRFGSKADICGAPPQVRFTPNSQKQSTEAEEIAKQHDNTRRALRDALPLALPSWSLPFYFGMHLDDAMPPGGA